MQEPSDQPNLFEGIGFSQLITIGVTLWILTKASPSPTYGMIYCMIYLAFCRMSPTRRFIELSLCGWLWMHQSEANAIKLDLHAMYTALLFSKLLGHVGTAVMVRSINQSKTSG